MTVEPQTIVTAGLPDEISKWLAGRLGNVGIRGADDVDGVLAELDRGDAQLLIINHTLRGLPAVDVLSRARARKAYRDLPVIYLLDQRLDSSLGRELLGQLGVDRVMLHPVDRDKVASEAAQTLNIPLVEIGSNGGSPARPPAPQPTAPARQPQEPPAAHDREPYLAIQPGSILIVDGDIEHGRQLVHEAAARGLQATLASTPQDARVSWTARRPDAVLLDLGIRNGNGEEGLGLLEELSRLVPPVPVLVMTARDTLIDRVQVAGFGGRGFLHRNDSPSALLEAAVRLLQQVRTGESRVLIVDDQTESLRELRSLLEPEGIRVSTLDDPLRFWDTLEQMAPDLLILDLDLTRWSGIELCRVVRNDPRWTALPVLFLTPRSDPETIGAIFAAGADDYVTKPVVGPELVTKVLNRLERTLLYRSMADLDPMTGVANRRKSTDLLRQFLRLAERHDQPLCVAILDLDWFKQINDRYGHDSGDLVLQHLGKVLLRTFRSEDVVARWGGEEFLIGMYGMNRGDGVQRLTDVLEQLRREAVTTVDGADIQVTFSAGVAQYPEDGKDLESLYRAADQALYRAKASGRDRVMAVGKNPASPDFGLRTTDVVIAESDEVLGSAMVAALEERGYRTHWIRDGETAAGLLGGGEPKIHAPVVLVDADLSMLDGLSVLRRLLRDHALKRTRVIVLTRRQNDAIASRALELGAFDLLPKPFALSVLVQRVRQALEIL